MSEEGHKYFSCFINDVEMRLFSTNKESIPFRMPVNKKRLLNFLNNLQFLVLEEIKLIAGSNGEYLFVVVVSKLRNSLFEFQTIF